MWFSSQAKYTSADSIFIERREGGKEGREGGEGLQERGKGGRGRKSGREEEKRD